MPMRTGTIALAGKAAPKKDMFHEVDQMLLKKKSRKMELQVGSILREVERVQEEIGGERPAVVLNDEEQLIEDSGITTADELNGGYSGSRMLVDDDMTSEENQDQVGRWVKLEDPAEDQIRLSARDDREDDPEPLPDHVEQKQAAAPQSCAEAAAELQGEDCVFTDDVVGTVKHLSRPLTPAYAASTEATRKRKTGSRGQTLGVSFMNSTMENGEEGDKINLMVNEFGDVVATGSDDRDEKGSKYASELSTEPDLEPVKSKLDSMIDRATEKIINEQVNNRLAAQQQPERKIPLFPTTRDANAAGTMNDLTLTAKRVPGSSSGTRPGSVGCMTSMGAQKVINTDLSALVSMGSATGGKAKNTTDAKHSNAYETSGAKGEIGRVEINIQDRKQKLMELKKQKFIAANGGTETEFYAHCRRTGKDGKSSKIPTEPAPEK